MTEETSRLTPYQRRLFLFLSVATFFEGYDFIALTQILPELRADMGLSPPEGGLLVAFINLGTVAAYLLVRKADAWGRRRVLTITIVGYTVATFLSGLAFNAYSFAAAQFLARVFLIGEWAISMVYAAEEFPASRRGGVIGIIGATSTVGAIVCVGVVPMLLGTPWGWRSVYFVGIVPLILLAFARRSLKESARFTEQVKAPSAHRRFAHIWSTPYRKRLLQMGAIWCLSYLCFQTAVTFWKEFAQAERGLTDGQVAASITIAALAGVPLVFGTGPIMDRIGRRWTAVLVYGLGTGGVLGCYTLATQWSLTAALVLGIAVTSAFLVVLNAFTTELFPTDLRADAYAWSNNLLGRIGYVTAPAVVTAVVPHLGWSISVALTTVFPVIALGLILLLLPETTAKELEETAAL